MNNSGIGAPGGRRTLGPRRPTVRVGASGAKSSARRCLFGPVDHQETDDFLKEMNRQFDEQKTKLWGFDFKAGRPVPEGHPVYEWVAVGANDDIPCAYGRMAESWRDPELASWANENTDMRGVSQNSYRSNDRSRKRLRLLIPDSPHLDTVLTLECSTSGDCPDHGLSEAVASSSKSSARLEASKPGSDDEPPLNDLRKSEEKLEKHSDSRPPDVPGFPEGSGLPSGAHVKVAHAPKDFPTGMEDGAMESPNSGSNALPERK